MKIGYDAKWFFDGPPSGKMVVYNHVKELTQKYPEYEFVIILDKKSRNKLFPFFAPNVSVCYVWSGNNLISNIFFVPLIVRKFNLDILISQNFVSPFGTYNKIALIYDVIFFTHPQYYTFFERLYFLPLNFLTKFAAKVVTISEAEKTRMVKSSFVEEHKINIVHLGKDKTFSPNEFHSKSVLDRLKIKYSLPGNYLLYVGRLNSRKNVPNLLRAFALLKNKDICLVLVGKHDWKVENLSLLIHELGIEDRILFTGSVPFEDLAPLYSLSKVFCFPSFEEAFGLPPLEAMASGIPVVVSNRTCLPEVCGEAGNYIDPDNPQDIADMIDLLLSDQTLYQEKRKKGLEQAKKFTWEESAKKLLSIIGTLKL